MIKTLVILQARTGSARLPAKVLLPVGGMPLVVLAARRAANTGLPVLVATSDTAADDVLATILAQAGIRCHRGSLENVLDRFWSATRDYADDTVIVRLTADNVFPDGGFVEELCARFWADARDYLGTCSPADGLPYGLSAEVFRLGAWRRIASRSPSIQDQEHVTHSLRRNSAPFRPADLKGDRSHLRCTVDNYTDYLRVAGAFAGIDDPVRVPWFEVMERLERQCPQPHHSPSTLGTALVLGTAQLGLRAYGRTNRIGQLPSAAALELVRLAVELGVREFDTARAYGDAESRLGAGLESTAGVGKVITKLDPLLGLTDEATREAVRTSVDASVFRSCRELRRHSLPVLLLHRWGHRHAGSGAIWERLLELQADGVIESLGASVSTPEEATEAFADSGIRHLQIPFNLLDGRWTAAGIDQRARERPEVKVHARSVFLQGLLLNSPEFWPSVPGMDPEKVLARIDHWVKRLGRQDRMDLCLAFARAQTWIHGLVAGVDSAAQLREVISHFTSQPLGPEEVRDIAADFTGLPEGLLNPALWPARPESGVV